MVTYPTTITAIQYATESTYGTEQAPNTAIGRVQSFTPTINNNTYRGRASGAGRLVQQLLYGTLNITWTLQYEAHDWDFLKYAVGPKTGNGNDEAPYVLTQGTDYGVNDIDSFSMEVSTDRSTDDNDTYLGCTIDGFTISSAIGQPVVINVRGRSRDVTSSTTATSYTEPTTKTWMWHQGTWYWGQTPSSVGRVQSFQINYENDPAVYADSGRFISIPTAGGVDITFQITVIMTETIATTLRDDLYGSSNNPVTGVSDAAFNTNNEFHLILTEGASVGNRTVNLKLDQCSLDTMTKPITLGGGLVQATFTGTAKTGLSSVPVEWYTTD